MESNKVTVLMCLYNTPTQQLRESIKSILEQTYKNFELLIIDDGSTQECVKVLEEFEDNRIKIVHNPQNIGLENSLNIGLKLAQTDYIVRMDTDDIAYKDRIEKQIKFVLNNPQYSVVSGRVDFFDDGGIYGTSNKSGIINKDDLVFGTPFIHPAMILKREDIMKCGGYPLYKRCEDYAMIMNMYANGYKGYIMDDILIKYRMDQDGYKKKKYRYRLTEAKVKLIYFKKMHVKMYQYIYIIKPLIVGLIPLKLLNKYHRNKLKQEKK